MPFKIFFLFLFVYYSQVSWGNNKKKCSEIIENVVNEMKEWAKYGIKRDSRGVVNFPTDCTPFMKQKRMIPLGKRRSGKDGNSRERYLADDGIYEWDSQHGAFEYYKPNSNYTSFTHAGERSAVFGEVSQKIVSTRDHTFSETGMAGITMKDLAKDHKKGRLTPKQLEKIKKNGLSCL